MSWMPNAVRRLALLLTGLLSLTGCATGSSETAVVLPVPVEYSPAFQAQLADEVEALPPGSALERAMLDYGRLRAELRAQP